MTYITGAIDMNKINKRLARANKEALKFVAQDMLGDDNGGITQYVPKKTGALRASGNYFIDITGRDASGNATGGNIYFGWFRPIYNKDGEELVSGDITVERLYGGYNPVTGNYVQNWTTAGTSDNWVQEAFNDLHEEWAKQYAESFTQQFRA